MELTGKKVCVTGTLTTMTRHRVISEIRRLGGYPMTTVTSNTDLVIVGRNPGSKLFSAQRLRIQTIDEKEFLNIIGKADTSNPTELASATSLQIMFAGGESGEIEHIVSVVYQTAHEKDFIITKNFQDADVLVILDDPGSLPNRMAGDRPAVRLWNKDHLFRYLKGEKNLLDFSMHVQPMPSAIGGRTCPDTYGIF